jgi:hypothetical protein
MSYGVYKIKFSISTNQLNDDYDRLSDVDKERVSEMNTESFFDWEESGEYNCILITTPFEVNKYLKILNSNLIDCQLIDVSLDILKSKINIINEIKDKVKGNNLIKYEFFVDDLNQWVKENLDIDIILDRISEVGLDNLSEIEKEFLNTYNI